jgi:hypothetical protein
MARQVWFNLLSPLNLGEYSQATGAQFADWWWKGCKKNTKRGYSLIILGAWMTWNHRNACVFEGAAPSVNSLRREQLRRLIHSGGNSKMSTTSGVWLVLGSCKFRVWVLCSSWSRSFFSFGQVLFLFFSLVCFNFCWPTLIFGSRMRGGRCMGTFFSL